jgi:hypothetical protein
MTANTAIDLVLSMEDELHQYFPDCNEENMCLYFDDFCSNNGEDAGPSANVANKLGFSLDKGANQLLKLFIDVYTILTTCPPNFRDENELASYGQTNTAKFRFEEDKARLLEYFSSLQDVVSTTSGSIPAEDEFTKASRRFISDRKISLWYLFAVIAYLTGRRILSGNVSKAHVDLQLTGLRTLATLIEEAESRRAADVIGRDQQSDDFVISVAPDIRDWITADPSLVQPMLPVNVLLTDECLC